MKQFLYLLLLLALTTAQAQNNTLNLIPQPVEIKQSNGFYTLTKSTTVGYNKSEGRDVSEKLAQKLNTATGFKISVSQAGKSKIQLSLNAVPDPKL